jgi:hypothetical protein
MSVCVGVCVWIGESVEGREVKGGDGKQLAYLAPSALLSMRESSRAFVATYTSPPGHFASHHPQLNRFL